jgi:glutathione synthase/RimK-type ligase-like ATP-grasp enzyme
VTVLILTNKEDLTADWVVRELRDRGVSFVRLNSEDLPKGKATWDSDTSEMLIETAESRLIRQGDLHSIWYRRPGRPFGDRPQPDSPEAVLGAQWKAFLDALALTSSARWINHPQANSAAESKIKQLRGAAAVGLRFPKTLVSNDPQAVARFRERVGDVVVKALDAPLVVVDGTEAFMFTTQVTDGDLDSESLTAAPMIFQARIEPRVDVRVTVVGDKVFAARAVGVTAQDWRLESIPVSFEPTEIDVATQESCVSLVRYLNLTFGAIDLLESESGVQFLEINPNGEWGWLQAQGFPIAAALVDVLA